MRWFLSPTSAGTHPPRLDAAKPHPARPRSGCPYVFALAALALASVPVFAAEAPRARNVILIISDGAGFNGWLATDYYEGRAGTQPYQVARPDGTRPYVGASAHCALRMFGPDGEVLDNDQWDAARGVEEQGYIPRDRWTRLEGAFMPRFVEEQMDFNAAVFHVMNAVFANEHRPRKAALSRAAA